MTEEEMEGHMEGLFTLVSAEPAHRASGVNVLNKPTVTTPKRATGLQREGDRGWSSPFRNRAPHLSDVFVRQGRFSVLM